MFLRKLFTFLIATALSYSFLILIIFQEWNDFFGTFLFFAIFATTYVLLYGVPVTVLSDKITNRISGIPRMGAALFVHLLFGMGFVFIIGLIFSPQEMFHNFSQFWSGDGEITFLAATVTSFFFWAVDEAIRFFQNKYCFQ